MTRRFLLLLLPMLALATPSCAADPDALAKIVIGKCVPNQRDHGDPAPCAAVDLAGGAAVLKDIVGATQYLLIPTMKIRGMESRRILRPETPDYWGAAWAARRFMEAKIGHAMPRDAISLAINAVSGRTQNQLHIHVDCLRPDVRAALEVATPGIGTFWAPIPGGLLGHPYRAMRVVQNDLAGVYPFLLLHQDPTAAADMAHETLVVVGASFRDGGDGFLLLADHADLVRGNPASGEELQDHGCALAHPG
jgi:CDP-diacylglycerol pyrophosphatase